MKKTAALAVIPLAALVLSACASPATGETSAASDRPKIVASTNVYGSIAEAVAGDRADVTSIIDSAAQDPHSYEASATDQLALSKADVVIENGGGYDPFIDTLLSAAGTTPVVINASDVSGLQPGDDADDAADHNHDADDHAPDETDAPEATDDPETPDAEGHDHTDDDHGHIEGFNEHVWYNFTAMENVAHELAHELGEKDPAGAEEYHDNFEAFAEEIHALNERAEGLAQTSAGAGALMTEPVPAYLLAAAGFTNLTPEAFSEAIEEGTDVSPATLDETLTIASSGRVRVLAYNEQTSGRETERVRSAAEDASVAVVNFTETLPENKDYVSWMSDNLDALAEALR